MYAIANVGGMTTPKQIKKDVIICQAQFLVEGKNFVKPIIVAVFNEDIKKVQELDRGQKVVLEFNQRLNKGFLNSSYVNHIADEDLVQQFEEIVTYNAKVPSGY